MKLSVDVNLMWISSTLSSFIEFYLVLMCFCFFSGVSANRKTKKSNLLITPLHYFHHLIWLKKFLVVCKAVIQRCVPWSARQLHYSSDISILKITDLLLMQLLWKCVRNVNMQSFVRMCRVYAEASLISIQAAYHSIFRVTQKVSNQYFCVYFSKETHLLLHYGKWWLLLEVKWTDKELLSVYKSDSLDQSVERSAVCLSEDLMLCRYQSVSCSTTLFDVFKCSWRTVLT